jgi:hypothetical protein
MAVPAFVAEVGGAFSGNVTTGTMAEPAGAANGQLYICKVRWFNTATDCTLTGWTSLGLAKQPNSGVNHKWFWCIRGASAPNLVVNFTGGIAQFSGYAIDSYSGATGIETIGGMTIETTYGNNPSFGGATTSLASTLAVTLPGPYQGSITAASSGWTVRTQNVIEKTMTSPGSTGGTGLTMSTNTWVSGITIGLASVSIPSPSWANPPTISGTPGVGNVLTANGQATYAYSNAYQWQYWNGSSWASLPGASTSSTYTCVAGDSKNTLRCQVTSTGGGGTAVGVTLGVSFYTLTSADVGHNLSATTTRTNSAGNASDTTANLLVQFQNTAKPGISGTAGAGNTYTAVAGTYVETVTARTYEWLADNDASTVIATGSTFTPTQMYGSRYITVRENVTGPSGTGTATSTQFKQFNAMIIPWGTNLTPNTSPMLTPLPDTAPIDSTWTATLQGYLNSAYSSGVKWWYNGGNHGAAYSTYLNIVTSDMPRTPWDLRSQTRPNPVVTPSKNGGDAEHLAWSWGVKNGGIPTPPYGWKIVPGSDATLTIYCADTYEYWDMWVADNGSTYPGANPFALWGCYIPDIRYFDGICQQLQGPGSGGYAPGGSNEFQYKSWGTTAAAPVISGLVTTRELLDQGSIEHMIAAQMTGNNHTHRYPVLRDENTFTGPMPLGGIWRIDPTIDLTTLPTLGSSNADNFRYMILRAIQKYGMFANDTTVGVNQIRLEAMIGTTYPNPVDFDLVMRSVPVTAWQVVKETYRPSGTPAPPPNPLISTQVLTDVPNWYIFGDGHLSGTGQLQIGAFYGAIVRGQTPCDLTGDSCFVRLKQGSSVIKYGVGTSVQYEDNIAQFEVDTVAHTIKCIATYNSGVVGTSTSTTYSATNHAWLQIREAAGVLYWEAAPDIVGVPGSWTTLRSLTIPGSFWDKTACWPSFYSPYSATTPGSGSAVLTNLNTIPAPVATSPGWVVGVA